jgi:hypothetical protein
MNICILIFWLPTLFFGPDVDYAAGRVTLTLLERYFHLNIRYRFSAVEAEAQTTDIFSP